MMKKKQVILRLVMVCTFGSLTAQKTEMSKAKNELQWHTRLEKAYECGKKKKKPVFAFFTGSDWCGWCKKLQAEVFSKPDFAKWAQKNVILLEIDFPRTKQLDQEQVSQNYSLQQTFGVMGYPTVWLFNLTKIDTSKKLNIIPIGQLGYPLGAEPGKEEVKFLHNADSLLLMAKTKTKKK